MSPHESHTRSPRPKTNVDPEIAQELSVLLIPYIATLRGNVAEWLGI